MEIVKLTPSLRRKLMSKKPDEKVILRMLKDGLSIWEVAERFWLGEGKCFKHSDRKTWIFYARVNVIRHRNKLNPIKLQLKNETKEVIKTFVSKFGEDKLVQLLTTNTRIKSN